MESTFIDQNNPKRQTAGPLRGSPKLDLHDNLKLNPAAPEVKLAPPVAPQAPRGDGVSAAVAASIASLTDGQAAVALADLCLEVARLQTGGASEAERGEVIAALAALEARFRSAADRSGLADQAKLLSARLSGPVPPTATQGRPSVAAAA